jgi:hypothetical protein
VSRHGGHCLSCGEPGPAQCRDCKRRAFERRDITRDDAEEPWTPPGGSYRNVQWVPNRAPFNR